MQQSLFASAIATEPVENVIDLNQQTLTDTVFTVIDVETTGLQAKKNALTEVVAIQFKNGQAQQIFSTLVRPTEAIPPELVTLTGITNEMVQNAPPVVTVLSDFCKFIGPNPIIVGHNVAFDIRFLREKLEQNGLSTLLARLDLQRAFCTKTLAQKVMPGLPSYEGIVVATQCGVYNPNPHRAEHDVRMSAGILFALFERIKQNVPDTPNTIQAILDIQGPLG